MLTKLTMTLRTEGKALRFFLRVVSVLYILGAILHVLDILDLRLKFSEMDLVWRIWIVFLCLADFAASFGLWKNRSWGIYLFFLIAVSQIVAYVGFKTIFGDQQPLIVFHLITLALFFILGGRLKTAL